MMHLRRLGLLIALFAAFAGGTGCHKKAAPSPTSHYPIRGKVVSIDKPGQTITLDHEAIPGFMEAMTMDYRVDDPAALGELHPGDQITATLLVDHDDAGPKNLRLHEVVVVAQAKPDYKPPVVYHVPQAGETVPNFKMVNQSGKTISIDQFHGKTVAMTFIYTRCPLSDYCPRMSHYFETIDSQLAKDPRTYARTHMLSVSFDPTYDTPKVLKSYGGGVTGKFTGETFKHWDFAAPQGAELLNMEKWFAVGVTPGENGTLSHSLATTVIGPDGKVIAFYPTNDWDPNAVLALMQKSAAS